MRWYEVVHKGQTIFDTMEDEEEKLISLSLQGDAKAFEQLILPYRKKIFLVCFQIVKDEQLAEDLTQETLLSAYRHLSTFQKKSKFYTWLYRIAHNFSVNALRKKIRAKEEVFNEEMAIPKEIPESGEGDEKWKVRLEEGLEALPEKQRLVLEMFDIRGIPHKEIAKILNISPGTVRSRLHYGRKKMRKLLEERIRKEGKPPLKEPDKP